MVEGYNVILSMLTYIERETDLVTKKTADKIVRNAKRNIRDYFPNLYDTGDMYNSISPARVARAQWSVICSGIDYAIFQEFGTVTIPARPFLGPAVREVVPEFSEQVARVFDGFRSPVGR